MSVLWGKTHIMYNKNIELEYLPELNEPLFIVGFDGWGNALDISWGMIDYLIRKLEAKPFGKIDPDLFYQFDTKRPLVKIKNGILKDINPPGGKFYAADKRNTGRDIIILKATEPSLRWYYFTDVILSLCERTGVKSIVSLGSMYDNVLHTDIVISAIASSEDTLSKVKGLDVISITYSGPSGIHSTLTAEAQKRGFECLNLWCHCPHYLQGTTHFGILSRLGEFLAEWGGFKLETEELSLTWEEVCKQIQDLIDKNPELRGMIDDIRKEKTVGTWSERKRNDKVIKMEDFFKSK